jgi:hypothetical protein
MKGQLMDDLFQAARPMSRRRLPDPVDEQTAIRFLGKCFGAHQDLDNFAVNTHLTNYFLDVDRADWETITGGTGYASKTTFIITVNIRNYSPSLRAWLEFWRIDELQGILEDLGEHVSDLCLRHSFTIFGARRDFSNRHLRH